MKDAVEGAYFYAWGQFRRQLRALGVPSKECDAKRHQIHIDALGYDKSHTKFTDRETNLVIDKFRELSGAIRTTDYERGCRIYVIRQICASIGESEEYAQAIADQMDREGRLLLGPIRPDGPRRARLTPEQRGEVEMKKWENELTRGPVHRRLLRELLPAELDKVIIALRKHEEAGVIAEPAGCRHGATPNAQRVGDFESATVADLEEEDPF